VTKKERIANAYAKTSGARRSEGQGKRGRERGMSSLALKSETPFMLR
jgi:hypothetical protein